MRLNKNNRANIRTFEVPRSVHVSLSLSLIHTSHTHVHTTRIHPQHSRTRTRNVLQNTLFFAIYSSIFLHEYLHRINLNHIRNLKL